VSYRIVDLASLASVREFVGDFRFTYPPAALICNAGVTPGPSAKTLDGFETVWQVSHLSHFLIAKSIQSLLPVGGRILFISSFLHAPPFFAKGLETDPEQMAKIPPIVNLRYPFAKLCNIWCAKEFARRFPELRVNAFDPSVMWETEIRRGQGAVGVMMEKALMAVPYFLTGKLSSVYRSAAVLASVACDEKFAETTGEYLECKGPATPSALAQDPARWTQLWEVSEAAMASD
jgi:WW domain-containing oxidoreductase